MQLLYWTASAMIALLITCDIFILTHPQLSLKKYPVFFFSLSILFYCMIYLNFYPLLPVILAVNSVLLAKFTGKLYTVFYVPIGYILSCVFGNMVGLLLNLFGNISVKDINSDLTVMLLYHICTMMVSFPVLYLIRRLLQKYFIATFEKMSRKLVALLALTLLLCSFMLLTMASFFDNIEITHREYVLMVSSLVLYFLFTVSMIFIVLHTTRKSYEARKKVEYLESLNEYTRNLEIVYDNLRAFKHDYINIMASLAAYIDEKKYEELERFFYDSILPMQKNLTQKNGALNNLLRVKILELKSILYTKLLLAVNQDIQVTIDIPDEIEPDSIAMDPVDLTRMLGIYLDNAIEACLETARPVLNFHLGRMNGDTVFIISNTFVDKGLSVAQMQKKGVTTKGNGHGIGLSNVSEILNRYDHIYHETSVRDGLFVQQVQISQVKKRQK